MKTTDELTHELLLTDCVNMGHSDLKQWLDAAFCAGLDKAVQLLRKEINTCHGPHSAVSIACQPCVARENSIVDIEAYRDRHGKPSASDRLPNAEVSEPGGPARPNSRQT